MSELASANFNTLIKILSNASKLDCQAAILKCRVGVLFSRRIVWASSLSAWIARQAAWLSTFFSFIFDEMGVSQLAPIVPEMWPKIKRLDSDLLPPLPPLQGISQLTSNNVNYPLLWSERHWNFNYVNSEPFCSKSADCFSIEGNVVPVWNLGTLNCKAWDVAEESTPSWPEQPGDDFFPKRQRRRHYLRHPVSPGILLRRFWQPACLAMSAIVEGVCNGWLCRRQTPPTLIPVRVKLWPIRNYIEHLQ